jgi:hypothetical protein
LVVAVRVRSASFFLFSCIFGFVFLGFVCSFFVCSSLGQAIAMVVMSFVDTRHRPCQTANMSCTEINYDIRILSVVSKTTRRHCPIMTYSTNIQRDLGVESLILLVFCHCRLSEFIYSNMFSVLLSWISKKKKTNKKRTKHQNEAKLSRRKSPRIMRPLNDQTAKILVWGMSVCLAFNFVWRGFFWVDVFLKLIRKFMSMFNIGWILLMV